MGEAVQGSDGEAGGITAEGALPKDLAPRSTVHDYLDLWEWDGGVLLMATVFSLQPFLRKLYADGGYAGPQFQDGLRQVTLQIEVQIVKRSDAAKGFMVLPQRWIVTGCIELPN